MGRILIIEDEERVSEVLKAYLEKEGYVVCCTDSGLDGIKALEDGEFDLVLLDLMLPDIDGEEVCRTLRRISDVHIFMLTAKGTLGDRIGGLDAGADEYLVKPLSPRELCARVNALFRRLRPGKLKAVSFNNGELEIIPEERSVRVRGREVQLTPNEFDMLYTLAANKGMVLTREQLVEKVFGLDFEGFDRNVDVHIKNIRKKIEEDSRNPRYIITVTRVGYKFGGDNPCTV